MSEYAVIQIAHRQYIVEPGKTYTVDKFVGEPGEKKDFVALAHAKGEKLDIGTPNLKQAVQVEIVEQGKGEKIDSFVYKAKSRYRRRSGFRKQTTTFKVLGIK